MVGGGGCVRDDDGGRGCGFVDGVVAVVVALTDRGTRSCGVSDQARRKRSTHLWKDFYAVTSDYSADMIRCLLECGAVPHCHDHTGFTPLIYVASIGESDVLEMLLGAVTPLAEHPIDDEPNDWLTEVLNQSKGLKKPL